MRRSQITACLAFYFLLQGGMALAQSADDSTQLRVKKTLDFQFSGDGLEKAWEGCSWIELPKRNRGGVNYRTRIKLLYSDSGMYCLYSCEDLIIHSTLQEDFSDLYREDVVEAFFWTDPGTPLYFEYELSPLNHELAILVPNFKGDFLGWRPWHYEAGRMTRHAATIARTGGKPSSWTAEFFIPFILLKPLQQVPPHSGSRWRANFYRIDYDQGISEWSWQLTRTNFHDYERFGTLLFE
jgi:hypothetical protein